MSSQNGAHLFALTEHLHVKSIKNKTNKKIILFKVKEYEDYYIKYYY